MTCRPSRSTAWTSCPTGAVCRARTIRYYQSEGLLPKPAKNGRDAVYGAEHVERLALIAELRDRGLTLGAIRDLVATDRPSRTIAEWLGVDATLKAPWSDDRPRVMSRAELTTLVGRRAGLVAELEDAGYLQSGDADTVLVPSPALLDLALQLHDAGIDVDISGQLRDLLRATTRQGRRRRGRSFSPNAPGTGFAGTRQPRRTRQGHRRAPPDRPRDHRHHPRAGSRARTARPPRPRPRQSASQGPPEVAPLMLTMTNFGSKEFAASPRSFGSGRAEHHATAYPYLLIFATTYVFCFGCLTFNLGEQFRVNG